MSGTCTTVIPAARAAMAPTSLSSKAKQRAGSIPSRRAASRYTSGAGLGLGTSLRVTTMSKLSVSPAAASFSRA